MKTRPSCMAWLVPQSSSRMPKFSAVKDALLWNNHASISPDLLICLAALIRSVLALLFHNLIIMLAPKLLSSDRQQVWCTYIYNELWLSLNCSTSWALAKPVFLFADPADLWLEIILQPTDVGFVIGENLWWTHVKQTVNVVFWVVGIKSCISTLRVLIAKKVQRAWQCWSPGQETWEWRDSYLYPQNTIDSKNLHLACQCILAHNRVADVLIFRSQSFSRSRGWRELVLMIACYCLLWMDSL